MKDTGLGVALAISGAVIAYGAITGTLAAILAALFNPSVLEGSAPSTPSYSTGAINHGRVTIPAVGGGIHYIVPATGQVGQGGV